MSSGIKALKIKIGLIRAILCLLKVLLKFPPDAHTGAHRCAGLYLAATWPAEPPVAVNFKLLAPL